MLVVFVLLYSFFMYVYVMWWKQELFVEGCFCTGGLDFLIGFL